MRNVWLVGFVLVAMVMAGCLGGEDTPEPTAPTETATSPALNGSSVASADADSSKEEAPNETRVVVSEGERTLSEITCVRTPTVTYAFAPTFGFEIPKNASESILWANATVTWGLTPVTQEMLFGVTDANASEFYGSTTGTSPIEAVFDVSNVTLQDAVGLQVYCQGEPVGAEINQEVTIDWTIVKRVPVEE